MTQPRLRLTPRLESAFPNGFVTDADQVAVEAIAEVMGDNLQEILASLGDATVLSYQTLPTTVVHNRLILVGGTLYLGVDQPTPTTVMTEATVGDQHGFVRGHFGNLTPDIPWIDALFWDDSEDTAYLRLRSPQIYTSVSVNAATYTPVSPPSGYENQGGGRQEFTFSSVNNLFDNNPTPINLTPSPAPQVWFPLGSDAEIDRLIALHTADPDAHHVPPVQIVQTLPATVTPGTILFVGNTIYAGVAGDTLTLQMTSASDGDIFGYRRGNFGSLSPDYDLIDELYWDESQMELVLRLRSDTEFTEMTINGSRVANIAPIRNGYTLQGGGRQQLESSSSVNTNPFPVGDVVVNFTGINPDLNEWKVFADATGTAEHLLAVHTANANAHHTPPDLTSVVEVVTSLPTVVAGQVVYLSTVGNHYVGREYTGAQNIAITADVDGAVKGYRREAFGSIAPDLPYIHEVSWEDALGSRYLSVVIDSMDDPGAMTIVRGSSTYNLTSEGATGTRYIYTTSQLNEDAISDPFPNPTDNFTITTVNPITLWHLLGGSGGSGGGTSVQFSDAGDIDFTVTNDIVTGVLKDDAVTPDKLAFAAGTQVGGRFVQLNAAADGFEGATAGAGGLNQGEVDARVELYTGQASPSGAFAPDRLPEATTTTRGAMSGADKTKIDAIPNQGAGNANRVLGYDASGNFEARVETAAADGVSASDFNTDGDVNASTVSGLIQLDVKDDSLRTTDLDFESGTNETQGRYLQLGASGAFRTATGPTVPTFNAGQFVRNAPGSDIVIAIPTITSPANLNTHPAQWSSWTDVTTVTVTEAGNYILEGEIQASTDYGPAGGGRWYSETRIQRTRATVDTVIALESEYHRNFDIGEDPQAWELAILEQALANDVYTLQVRVRRQANGTGSALNSAAVNVTIDADNTELIAMSAVGAKGDKGDKGDRGDRGIQGIQGIQGNPGAAGTVDAATLVSTIDSTNGDVGAAIASGGVELDLNDDVVRPDHLQYASGEAETVGQVIVIRAGNEFGTADLPTGGGNGGGGTGEGLNEAAVDARIETFTGQTSPTGEFAPDRLPEVSTSVKGAMSPADKTKLDAIPNQGDTNNADKVISFDSDGNYVATDPVADLPKRLRDFSDDLTGDGYGIVTGAMATTSFTNPPNLATVAGLTYADEFEGGPIQQNHYYPFRLSTGESLGGELWVGDADLNDSPFARNDATDATSLGTQGNFDYYLYQIDDKPAGDDVFLVQLDPLQLPGQISWDQITGRPGHIDDDNLNAEEAAALIQSYTGQTSPSGELAANRLPLATQTVRGTLSGTDATKLRALPDQGPGMANQVVGYDENGNYIAKDEVGDTEIDARIQLYTGQTDANSTISETKLPPNELDTTVLNEQVAFTLDASGDVDAGGNTNALALGFSVGNQAFTLRRIFFDNSDSVVIVDLSNFTDSQFALLSLGALVIDGDTYYFADGTADPYVAADNTREVQWSRIGIQPAAGTKTVRVYDLRIASNTQPGLMSPAQVVTLESALQQTDLPAQNRLAPDPSGFTSSDNGSIAVWDEDDQLWVNGAFGDDINTVARYREATNTWSFRVSGGSLTPDRLDGINFLTDRGQFLRLSSDGTEFETETLIGQQEVFSGALTGVAVGAVSSNSSVQQTALSETVDLDTQGHGLIGGTFTISMSSASSVAFGFDTSASQSINVTGFLSLEVLAASPNYLATSSQYGLTLDHVDVYSGSTIIGAVLIRLAHDANGIVGLNIQYVADADHSVTGQFNIGAMGSLVLLASGAPRGEVGSGGPIYEFADDLPDLNVQANQELYPDGSLGLVYSGTMKRLARKQTVIVHNPADTELGGVDVEPTGAGANLSMAADGRYTHLYWARIPFTNRGTTSLPANTLQWEDAPTTLNYLDFNYRTATVSDGEIRLVYSSARGYTGDLVITPGDSNPITVNRISSTIWYVSGLTGAQIASLRENTWRITEPGQTPTSTSATWETILIEPQPITRSVFGRLIATSSQLSSSLSFSGNQQPPQTYSWTLGPGASPEYVRSGTILRIPWTLENDAIMGYTVELVRSSDNVRISRGYLPFGPGGASTEGRQFEQTWTVLAVTNTTSIILRYIHGLNLAYNEIQIFGNELNIPSGYYVRIWETTL